MGGGRWAVGDGRWDRALPSDGLLLRRGWDAMVAVSMRRDVRSRLLVGWK